MRCPNCSQENPEGRGFCINCAYPLPEEPRRPEPPEPVYEPISFDPPDGRGVVPTAAQGRKRTIVIGIASLVLGLIALSFVRYAMAYAVADPSLIEYYSDAYGVERLALTSAMYVTGCTFAVFSLICGILGTVFGAKALGRLQKQPEMYSGKGVYFAGLIASVLATACAAVLFAVNLAMI